MGNWGYKPTYRGNFTPFVTGKRAHLTLIQASRKKFNRNLEGCIFIYLVVEPTHLKNILVENPDHFSLNRDENNKHLKPPPRCVYFFTRFPS